MNKSNNGSRCYYNCYVYGCLNSTRNSKYGFFRVPKEPERDSEELKDYLIVEHKLKGDEFQPIYGRRRKWLKLMQRDELIGSALNRARVCEAHFHPRAIVKTATRTKLRYICDPTLLLPDQDNTSLEEMGVVIKSEKVDASVQYDYEFPTSPQVPTPLHLSEGTTTRKRKKNEKEIVNYSNKRAKLSRSLNKIDFYNLCDKYLNKNLTLIIKQQTKVKARLPVKALNFDFRIFCLNLFYVSPLAYDLLKYTLGLPSKETLIKMYLPVTSEINIHLMSLLKAITQNKSNMNRNCSLVINTISLKPNLYYNIREDRIYGFHEVSGVQFPGPARYAVVAMIQGLFENYKQLVGFALLAECKNYESVSDWIDILILELFSIGLNVRVLVSDLSSDFSTSRNISAERPFFLVGERKIYYISDPARLFTSVRDYLMNYDFHFENSVAKWQHIIQFHEADKLKKRRLAPKLADNHIKPKKVEKTQVKYAAQVLSATVAAGLSAYRDFGAIESSAEGTIKFIEMMNDLFDFLNSSSRRGTKLYQKAFCGEEYQTSFVNEMLNFFALLKVINPSNGKNVTSKVKFIEGFQITLKSILLLFEDLKMDGFSYLLTRRIKQDCLKNFFDRIRTKNGKYSRPTPWQLVSAFKKECFINILKSRKSLYCAVDLAKCLLDVEKLQASSVEQDPLAGTDTTLTKAFNINNKNKDFTDIIEIPSILTTDYNSLVLPKTKALAYVSRFLLRKCLGHHNECKAFLAYVIGEEKSQTIEVEIPPIIEVEISQTIGEEKSQIIEVEVPPIIEVEKSQSIGEGKYQNGDHDSTLTNYENGSKDILETPPESFVKFVRSMEERFCYFFKMDACLNCEVLSSILYEIGTLSFPMPCQCFPLEYCRRLFIRMRLYHTLKNNNRAFRLSKN